MPSLAVGSVRLLTISVVNWVYYTFSRCNLQPPSHLADTVTLSLWWDKPTLKPGKVEPRFGAKKAAGFEVIPRRRGGRGPSRIRTGDGGFAIRCLSRLAKGPKAEKDG
jgi:hypothetical protein